MNVIDVTTINSTEREVILMDDLRVVFRGSLREARMARAADQLNELLPMVVELAAQAGIASKKPARR